MRLSRDLDLNANTSLPIVSRQLRLPHHGDTQCSHLARLGRSPGTSSKMDLR
jgi:hypothetical protein